MTFREGDWVVTPKGRAVVMQTDVCCGPGLIYLVEPTAGERFLIGARELLPALPPDDFITRTLRLLRASLKERLS